MEMYYGEPSIKNLIVHSKQIIEHVKEFNDVYNLTEERVDQINEIELTDMAKKRIYILQKFMKMQSYSMQELTISK